MKKFMKSYAFIVTMLIGIVAGCVVGALFPREVRMVDTVKEETVTVQIQDAATGEMVDVLTVVEVPVQEEQVVNPGAKGA